MRKDNDALAEMRKRYDRTAEFCATLYDHARDDIKFVTVPGEQWDSKIKARRGDRPCYEFPKLQAHVRQVVNEMRQGRPQGKVRGVEESDTGLAEIMQGLCRNIESVSNADQAYDIAFEAAVKGGFGAWRICTDYEKPDSFDQSIYIKPIHNALSAKCDPAAMERDRRDAMFWFVEETISKDEFKKLYPKAQEVDFDSTDNEVKNWRDADKIRIAEYWYKKPVKRELWALSDGRVVFADEMGNDEDALTASGIQIVKRRMVDDHKVYMRMTSGVEWLTDEYEFPSKHIPIVPVWGQIDNVDGEDYWQGLVRQCKDQQRLHNVHRTAMIEAVAKAPKAPFILKQSWIKGLESFWKKANSEDFPYLPVNDEASGLPQRANQAEVPAALIQMAGMDNDDLKASTGIYDASLGARSNETSGVAINSRKQQGAVATFNYTDNLTYAIRFTYEILIDMIPKVIDTPRAVRILGEDGGEDWKQLYQTVVDPVTGKKHIVNDIGKGRYDVVITVGPTYATQRMEAVDAFTQLAGQVGPINPVVGSLLAWQVLKNMDLPGSEEVSEAFRLQLVKQGVLQPEKGDPLPPPPQPDPRIMADVQKKMADAKRAEADANKTDMETQLMPAKTMAEIGKDHAGAVDTHAATVEKYHRMVAPPMPSPSAVDQADGMQPPQVGF